MTTLPWLDKLRGLLIRDDGVLLDGAGRVGTIDFINSTVTFNPVTGVATVDPSGGSSSIQKLASAAGTITTTNIPDTLLFIATASGMYRFTQILKLAGSTVSGLVDLSTEVDTVQVQGIQVGIGEGSVYDASDSMLIWLDVDSEVKYSVALTSPNTLSCNWAVCCEMLAPVV